MKPNTISYNHEFIAVALIEDFNATLLVPVCYVCFEFTNAYLQLAVFKPPDNDFDI